jgi:ethanolamine utilization protein EutN
MQIGKVVGRVVATRKDERLIGAKLMLVQPIDPAGELRGDPIVAVDTVGAGTGEQVIYVTGSMAGRAAATEGAPVDAAIVGIIDSIE